MATLAAVPVDEYLSTSYEQDKELVDGRLIDKGVPTLFHQLLSAVLLHWFQGYEKELGIKAVADVRTEIVERARYRVPDVMVFSLPMKAERIVRKTPDVVIEILSPDDRQSENLLRFRDYQQLGVSHFLQMDPEEHIAWRFEDDSLIKTEFSHLLLGDGRSLPFNSGRLFKLLREEIAAIEGAGQATSPH